MKKLQYWIDLCAMFIACGYFGCAAVCFLGGEYQLTVISLMFVYAVYAIQKIDKP